MSRFIPISIAIVTSILLCNCTGIFRDQPIPSTPQSPADSEPKEPRESKEAAPLPEVPRVQPVLKEKPKEDSSPKPAIEKPAPLKKTAMELKPQILEADGNSVLPDRLSSPRFPREMQDTLSTEEEILFNRIIQLKEEKSLFFVWNEQAFGVPIQEAHYEHRVTDALNRVSGEVDRLNVSFDSVNRRWFIPFGKLFQNRVYDADPTHEHLIILDLLFSDSSKIQVRIRFRANGPMIYLKRNEMNRDRIPRIDSFTRQVRESSWTLRREEIVNPTSRRFILWFKANGENLTFHNILTHGEYHTDATQPPSGPFWSKWMIRGSVFPRKLLVQRQASRQSADQIIDFQPGIWFPLELSPGEKVVLSWLAVASAGSPVCSVPPSLRKTYTWYTYTRPHCSRGGECSDSREIPHEVSVTEPWVVTGSWLTGTWGREIRFADPFITREEATMDWRTLITDPRFELLHPRIRIQFEDQATYHEGGGESLETPTRNFPCQGLI